MRFPPLRAVLVMTLLAGPAVGQPPAAVLGDPAGLPAEAPRPPEARPTVGREDVGALLGVGLLAARNGLPGYSVTWFPSQRVARQATDLGLVRQELSLFTPILREGPDTATLSASIRNSLFDTGAILPDANRKFPGALWDISLGVAHTHAFENGWTGGIVVTAGSASDEPFKRSDVLNASLFGYMVVPAVGHDSWIFGLYYSPTADLPYPIPAIAYYWRPNETFEASIGIPFVVKWKPWPDLMFDFFYFPLRTVRARATWELQEGISTYAAFNWSNESYFLAERPNRGDRFFSYEKRLAAGLEFDLPWSLRLDIAAGYTFDRFYFQGRRYADRERDRIDVGGGVFGAVQLRLRF